MMTEQLAIARRENMRKLIQHWGGPSVLAKKMGHVNASFLVQMAGPNPTRNVSERTARTVEQALGLEAGWVDRQHSAPSSPLHIDAGSISGAIQRVQSFSEQSGVKLSTAKFGDVVAILYESATSSRNIDDDLLRKIISLAN